MLERLHSRMRSLVTMFCMVLMAVVVAQGAIVTVDQAKHAYGVDHPPTPIAGEVHFDHSHDDDHGDAVELAQHGDHDGDKGGETPRHHHTLEGPQLAMLGADRPVEIARVGVVRMSPLASEGLPQRMAARLERPPKSISKTLA